MVVVVEGHRRCGLDGPRHHEPHVLAHLRQVAHQVAVTGVEPGPHPGQVGALRQGVGRQHPVGPVLEDRARPTVPGELGVALVGQHRHVAGPAPGGGGAQVDKLPRRVRGAVHPQAQGPGGVVLGHVGQAGVRDRPASGQGGAHGVRRVAGGRVEHGVPVRPAQPQPVRGGGHPLLGAHAGCQL